MTRHRFPLPILIVAVLATVVVIIAISGGAKKGTQPAQAAASAISLGETPAGKALVDAHGRALYLFLGDKPNLSRLSAAGQAVWPPFTAASFPAARGGASHAAIGAIARKQITYNGHPLYYYVGDHRAGQTAGQGLNEFGARWYVVSAAGAAITVATPGGSASTPASPATGGGAGHGY